MANPSSDYLRTLFVALTDGYPDDCVVHACRLVELLLVECAEPWIGRLRDIQQVETGVFHGPLIPTTLSGRHARTWTTHYVACAGDRAYDPLMGEAVALREYARRLFGRDLAIETLLGVDRTAELFRAGKLRATIQAR
ncbi:MAG: hypothetical protein QOI24_915 [Acidobacteriota bacterium]|jgi:hypothetical protein|nr:hypothetical protein [Acidobacteriota bacterium]